MTKKDYIALAEALAGSKPVGFAKPSALNLQWERDVRAIADVCGRDNPRFDRARFMLACGLIGG